MNTRTDKKTLLHCKGFTLIELLVVIAIIGILAAIGIPFYNQHSLHAKVNATKANHINLKKFIESEFTKCAMQSNDISFEYLEVDGKTRKTYSQSCPHFTYLDISRFADYYIVYKMKNPFSGGLLGSYYGTPLGGTLGTTQLYPGASFGPLDGECNREDLYLVTCAENKDWDWMGCDDEDLIVGGISISN